MMREAIAGTGQLQDRPRTARLAELPAAGLPDTGGATEAARSVDLRALAGIGEPAIRSLQATAGNAALTRALLAQRQPSPPPRTQTPPPGAAVGGATPAPVPGSTPNPAPGAPAVGGTGPAPAVDPVEANLKRIEAELPSVVKSNAALKTRAQRLDFLRYMRPFFGSDTATIDHFTQIRVAAVKGATTHLHEQAAARVEAVQAEIGTSRMPSSGGVGWSFREAFATGEQTLYDLHRIGMAIDYNAADMPHLGSGQRGGRQVTDPRQLDLISIITGRAATMNVGVAEKDLLPLLKEIGEAAMSDDVKARDAVFARADVMDLLAKVRSEAADLIQASVGFQVSLGDQGDRLIEIQKEYFATSDATRRKALVAELQTVLVPWLGEVDAALVKADERIVATGFAGATLPAGAANKADQTATTRLGDRVSRTAAQLKKARKPGRKALAAAEALVGEARTALGEPAWSPGSAPPGTTTPGTTTPGTTTPGTTATGTTATGTTATGTTTPAPGSTGTPAPAAAAVDPAAQLIAELGRVGSRLADRSTALKRKVWRDRVADVRLGLTTDVAFVLGREAGSSGKAQVEVGLPSLAQLTERGFFSTREVSTRAESFGIDFIEAMVKRGFYQGARYENPDSMHFELRWEGGV
jgi:hypothetical protein